MGIEQKQTFRVTCDRHGCNTSIEYDSWLEVEEKQFATDGGFSSIYITRFGPFQDFPENWGKKYSYGGKYDFYCPDCSKRMKDEETQRKEESERNRAKNLRKQERYNRVIGR